MTGIEIDMSGVGGGVDGREGEIKREGGERMIRERGGRGVRE